MAIKKSARYLWLGVLLGGSWVAASAGAQDGSVEAGRTKSATCAACHGVDGNSVTPDWPMLAGQHASYIVRQLRAFKEGERTNVTMKPFADMLSEQDMLDVAAYFAAQTPTPKGADPALVGLGQQIYRGGVPDRGVAACIACHGPEGNGNPLAAYPRISAQHASYTTAQLNAYRTGERRSDVELNQMMRNVAAALFDDEIRALASYMQGLN
jgi:cytochrome c553